MPTTTDTTTRTVTTRAVESEFKSNLILSEFIRFLIPFYPIFIRFFPMFPIFRLFPTFRLADSTALVTTTTINTTTTQEVYLSDEL